MSQLIRLITRIVTASVAATMGKRKAAPMESALPDDHEQKRKPLPEKVPPNPWFDPNEHIPTPLEAA